MKKTLAITIILAIIIISSIYILNPNFNGILNNLTNDKEEEDSFNGTESLVFFPNVQSDSIDIKIDKIDHFGIEYYRIYYRSFIGPNMYWYDENGNLKHAGENWTDNQILMFKSTEKDGTLRDYLLVTLSDLSPDTLYEIKIVGDNGSFLNVQQVRTKNSN
jgi:hypothetical protein